MAMQVTWSDIILTQVWGAKPNLKSGDNKWYLVERTKNAAWGVLEAFKVKCNSVGFIDKVLKGGEVYEKITLYRQGEEGGASFWLEQFSFFRGWATSAKAFQGISGIAASAKTIYQEEQKAGLVEIYRNRLGFLSATFFELGQLAKAISFLHKRYGLFSEVKGFGKRYPEFFASLHLFSSGHRVLNIWDRMNQAPAKRKEVEGSWGDLRKFEMKEAKEYLKDIVEIFKNLFEFVGDTKLFPGLFGRLSEGTLLAGATGVVAMDMFLEYLDPTK